MLPTLRGSIPDPISLDRWPELTRATTTDVIVAGVSMLRVVDLLSTPCAHAAAAVVPGSGGFPSPTLKASAVVVRIVALSKSQTGVLQIEVDGRVDSAEGDDFTAIHSEARLIGRASTAKVAAATLVDARRASSWGAANIRQWPLVHGLPADLVVGDLLAIPYKGRVHSWQLARTDGSAAGATHTGSIDIESWLSSLA